MRSHVRERMVLLGIMHMGRCELNMWCTNTSNYRMASISFLVLSHTICWVGNVGKQFLCSYALSSESGSPTSIRKHGEF